MKHTINRIVEVEHLADSYALLRYEGDSEAKGSPGQFVMVRGSWGDHPILPRAFSLVEVGERGAILVRQVGEGTRRLVEMRPGDELTVQGPLGKGYQFSAQSARPVLVAGGVGVAPLLFLAEQYAAAGVRPIFLYGARGSKDLLLTERIAKVCDLSITTEDGSEGERGFVTVPLERLLSQSSELIVFSCGPELMLEAVARACVQHKTPCQVALESPMACGMGTCKGCAVLAADGQYKYVCSDGPAFNSVEIWGGEK